jgi:hypothetical protein
LLEAEKPSTLEGGSAEIPPKKRGKVAPKNLRYFGSAFISQVGYAKEIEKLEPGQALQTFSERVPISRART